MPFPKRERERGTRGGARFTRENVTPVFGRWGYKNDRTCTSGSPASILVHAVETRFHILVLLTTDSGAPPSKPGRSSSFEAGLHPGTALERCRPHPHTTMSGEEDVKPVNVDPRWCVSGPQVSIIRTNELTPGSIQEALRIYFQPIKNDDPQLDFYTMYKRETMEYDTEYMQKYNEDLNTTLIFVRPNVSFHYIVLTTITGRSVLRSQLRLRHRRPVQTRARFH